jgi:DNA-binding transcriptional LysR family regulator
MDLSQRVRAILSFSKTIEAGSFVGAALALGISKAAVSKNVTSLEQVLGVRLINRTTRTLNLTAEGAVFLKQARVALDALDLAVDAVVTQRMEISGLVRISTSASFGRDHLLPALPGLRTRYPALSVAVDFDDRVVDLVGDGYDLAIRGGHIADSALIARPVCHLRMVLVASPEYLASAGVPENPQALRQHKLIVRRFLGGRVSPWSFRAQDGTISTLDVSDAEVTLSAPEALAQAASMGMGIAQVGVHHAWEYLLSGNLKIVLLGVHEAGEYQMVLQYPHRALVAPRVKATVEYLLGAFGQQESLHVPLAQLQAYVG